MIRTLRCTVSYDGAAFAGFQRQPGRATVQAALEQALGRVTRESIAVVGAGRTDAGVHATGQVIHFRTSSSLAPATLQRAANACLPDTVSIRALEEAPDGFHARFDARSREYRYVVDTAEVASPLWRQRAFHVPHALSLEAMHAALQALQGRHDFAAFGSPMQHTRQDGEVRVVLGGTVRTLFVARCWRRQRFILFCFAADAFLRHMVRMLVGTALRVGRGRLPVAAVTSLLRGERSVAAGPAVPAHGLYLTRVRY